MEQNNYQKLTKKCIFCDWERLYKERRDYDWDYVCQRCCKLCGIEDKWNSPKEAIDSSGLQEAKKDGVDSHSDNDSVTSPADTDIPKKVKDNYKALGAYEHVAEQDKDDIHERIADEMSKDYALPKEVVK